MRAYILRLTPYKDTDAIVELFSPELGKISAYARQMRQSKSRFPNQLELFTRYEVELGEKKSDLPQILHAYAEESFFDISKTIEGYAAACAAIESMDLLIPPQSPIDGLMEVFEKFLCSLIKCCEYTQLIRLCLLWFETRLQSLLNLLPDTAYCAKCANLLRQFSFFVRDVGFLCSHCEGSQIASLRYPLAARSLRRLADEDLDEILLRAQNSKTIDLEASLVCLRQILRENMQDHSERKKFKANDYFDSLS